MIKLAVIGDFQDGKSTFINALLGEHQAETGIGMRTTERGTEYDLNDRITLIDTPGFNSPDFYEQDREEALSCAQKANLLILFLRDKQITDPILKTFKECLSSNENKKEIKPFIVIMNLFSFELNEGGLKNIVETGFSQLKTNQCHPIILDPKYPFLCINAKAWAEERINPIHHKRVQQEHADTLLHFLSYQESLGCTPAEKYCALYENVWQLKYTFEERIATLIKQHSTLS